MLKKSSKSKTESLKPLSKCPTGIKGIDEITQGGLPRGRPTLICGAAGSGKTLFSAEFLYHGAMAFNEPGLFISFEESQDELITNLSSLGFDFKKLTAQKKIAINYVRINRSDFEEVGAYNLDGLFIQLDYLVKTLKIKRIVIDTLEVLFSNLTNHAILRCELERLFNWFKEKKLTAIITAESGEKLLSRNGLEEYVADCVILLDNRIVNQISTRRLRIIKYRGSTHGANEYPFLISKNGILVLPITSLGLDYQASKERVSTGIKRLDKMLGNKGYYRGSSILISGVAGAGKSSLAAVFANSICESGKKCLYFAFEESVSQIIRNMKSIGINLDYWVNNKLLKFHATQPYSQGLESHLVIMHDLIEAFKPAAVIIDPITNLQTIGNPSEVKALFARLIDYIKMKQITVLSTSLLSDSIHEVQYKENVSSLMDTWILLQNLESNGEKNRGITILKSRGMKNSNQVREIVFTDDGVDIEDVYLGGGKILAGSARVAQEARDKVNKLVRENEEKLNAHNFKVECKNIESQIESLQAKLQSLKDNMRLSIYQDNLYNSINIQEATDVSDIRMADDAASSIKKKRKTNHEK